MKDRKAIREFLVTDFVSDDDDVTCMRVVTERLLAELYGGEAGCRREQAEPDGERVAVSMIEVQGSRASAHVRWTAGDLTGVQGGLLLIDQEGGWRVDDLSSDLLRSVISVSFGRAKSQEARIQGLGASLSQRVSRGLSDCMEREFVRISERGSRKSFYAMLRKEPQAQRRLARLMSSCQKSLREDLSPEQRDQIDFRAGFMNSCAKQSRRSRDLRSCLCTLENLLRAYDNDVRRLGAAIRRVQRGAELEPALQRAYARCVR